jgi:sulfur carrier protein ThiS
MVKVNMPDGKVKECKRTVVKDILEELNLNENAVLVTIDGELVTPDINVPRNGEITIISVVSGG